MLNQFKSYQLALELHQACKQAALPHYVRDQLLRASLSVVLNLGEDSAKLSRKDKARFYGIAFASLREVQSLIDVEPEVLGHLDEQADKAAAHIYKLIRNS